MSTSTPAAHLARVKVTFHDWIIRHVDGQGFEANLITTGEPLRLWSPTLSGLEAQLIERERRGSRT